MFVWLYVCELVELDMVVIGWSNDVGVGLCIEYNWLLFDVDVGECWLGKLCLLL